MKIVDIEDGYCEITVVLDKIMVRIDELEYLKEKIDGFLIEDPNKSAILQQIKKEDITWNLKKKS